MMAKLLISLLVMIPVFTLNIINITGRTGNNGKKYWNMGTSKISKQFVENFWNVIN